MEIGGIELRGQMMTDAVILGKITVEGLEIAHLVGNNATIA